MAAWPGSVNTSWGIHRHSGKFADFSSMSCGERAEKHLPERSWGKEFKERNEVGRRGEPRGGLRSPGRQSA